MSNSNIFFIHFAGGSALSYGPLISLLPHVSIYSPELPGRGMRMRESLLDDVEEAKCDILRQIEKNVIPHQSVLFGHSMGALLVFLVASELEKKGIPLKQLILCGEPGFGLFLKKKIHNYPREDFRSILRAMGGISPDFWRHEELFNFYEPILRADIKLAFDMSLLDDICVSTSIHALMGSEEEDSKFIQNWRKYTSGSFTYDLMDGGHFFIFKNRAKVVALIDRYLT